jgi:cation:H+ antiporter
MIFQIVIFIVSIVVLSWLSSHLVKTLVDIAKYLRWREFIIAFFAMAFATSLSNLFIDLNAALRGMPEIAFGDIVGGNLVDLTLIAAIAVFFTKKSLPADSKMVQGSTLFTILIAILPLLMIWDGNLTRGDGLILIFSFFVYAYWVFSKKDRFQKFYKKDKNESTGSAKSWFAFLLSLGKMALMAGVLLAASFVVVNSVQLFADKLGVSLSLVAVLILGLGNCLPEAYFAVISAKKGEGWMVLGELMGSVIICATLVLGIIALIVPFEVKDFSPFVIARAFTLVAALFFLVVVKTGQKITKKEGLLLLSIYIAFLITEIFVKF